MDQPPTNGGPSSLQDMAFGCFAGSTSKLFEHPFDLLKVRLQSQPLHTAKLYSGPWDCLKQTVSREGYLGLYRGLTSPMLGATLENAVVFVVYGKLSSYFRQLTNKTREEDLSLPLTAVAAAAAGSAASFVLTPVEYVKCVMQVQQMARGQLDPGSAKLSKPPPGPISIIASTLRTQGIKGMWIGQTGTLVRESGGTVAWFGTFEALTRFIISTKPLGFKRDDLSAAELVLSGASAGACYNILLFPADSIKSAVQTSEELGGPKRSFLEMAKAIYTSRGLKGFYLGAGITVSKSAVSSAGIFWMFEMFRRQFRD